MKRGKRPRKRKLKPHETLDGLKGLASKAAEHRGHTLQWLHESASIVFGHCSHCGALAVIVLQPAGMENVITGGVINRECPNRQQGATL